MTATSHKIYVGLFFIVGIAVTALLAVNGFEYYKLPIEERFFNQSHNSLKPSGFIGHGVGILGTLMMIFGVAVYMIRKRFRAFVNIGYLKYWLEFHIFLCTLGPILVLYHTAFKFGGIVAISFWSMVAVVLSGVIGRYIYVQIPRRISGQEISIKELTEMNDELIQKLEHFSLNKSIIEELNQRSMTEKYKRVSFGRSLGFIIKDRFLSKSFLKSLKKELSVLGMNKSQKKEIIKLSKTKLILARRIGLLRTFQKMFKYWHIVHLPFALVMFVIMIVHVVITITFGYKWIF